MIDFFDRLAVRLKMVLAIPINTSAVIILAFYTLFWGLWVAMPWASFDSSRFTVLAAIAPEVVWGIIAISVGYVMTVGVMKHSFKSLSRGAFVGFLHWIIISTAYFWADWTSTGWITALTVAVYCGFIYLNPKAEQAVLPV